MKARFITIEGGEGAGKTTALGFIENYLRKAGIPLIVTREPGGTFLGEQLREILLNPNENTICGEAELLMMFAARAQHLQDVIYPALEQGRWVLCDRFTDATFAYQGGGRQLDEQPVALLEALVQGSRRPDLTLLLDVPVEIGLQRARKRGELDRFETEQVAFFERVRHVYLARAAAEPGRICVIDAQPPLDEVQRQIDVALSRLEIN